MNTCPQCGRQTGPLYNHGELCPKCAELRSYKYKYDARTAELTALKSPLGGVDLAARCRELERANGELRRVIEADRVDFVDLNEYWNGGNGAAVDACTHTCEITELALKRHAALTAPASGGEKG